MHLIIFDYSTIFIVSVLFLFAIIYIIVKRFVIWGIDNKLYRFISYVLGSLLFLHLFFLLLLFSNQTDRVNELLPFFIQVMAIFGFCILISNGLQFLWKKTVKKA